MQHRELGQGGSEEGLEGGKEGQTKERVGNHIPKALPGSGERSKLTRQAVGL